MELKPYTLYQCRTRGCGKSSLWTGGLVSGKDRDGICSSCGEEMQEFVDDGRVYKVSWEVLTLEPAGEERWHPSSRETNNKMDAVNQYKQLHAWELNNEQGIRNVKIERSINLWEPFEVDP
jgi:hypothetical protein